MKHIGIHPLILAVLLLLTSRTLSAQWQFSAHIDAGEHNASEGFYLRTAGEAEYRTAGTRFAGSLQFEPAGNTPSFLTGLRLGITQDLKIREFPLELSAFFLHKPYSDLQYENNWGLLARTGYRQFHVMLGNGFRAFRLTPRAIAEYPGTDNTVIRENWNLIYRIGYGLKPAEHPWNVEFALTNFDHFLMNQETNPMLTVRGSYEAIPDLHIFAEAWYKQAGVFNISANYFGFFFRTGISYEI